MNKEIYIEKMHCIDSNTCMKPERNAIYYTARELAERGKDQVPDELLSSTHLIYSSPATLAFNSPGAEGFGVKRAGLAIPDSVMLLVAPGCCGRNTSLVSNMQEYRNRFFFLVMDETDIVTGRHLKKIPAAVGEIINCLKKKPSVVMICITCVDALLGTDMERICRKAEEKAGIPVRPCYMYALTREGRKPPMVHVRQSIYSLLETSVRKGDVVNLLGYFAPLEDDCEIYDFLKVAGVKKVNEISRCRDFEEYKTMAQANFNLVLNPEARYAAADLEKRLQIPFIELKRLYQIEKIENQYRALAQVLGFKWDDTVYKQEAENAIRSFREDFGPLTFAVGECVNADPFELSCALLQYGFRVSEIYGTVSAENFLYIRKIAAASPKTRIYSNLEPAMLYYDCSELPADITIGKDAGYYHTAAPNITWNRDIQPFGYRGVVHLFESLREVLV